MANVDYKKLQDLMNAGKIVLVDVREAGELTSDGKIPISVHIPIGELTQKIASVVPNKAETIVLHCKSGMRASNGAGQIKSMGYTNVYVFPGGVREWMANQK